MKLYIPTCTLNFNNILSSESISPVGFYAKREYGNRRFYPVCANDKEQAILLFSKYPRFQVDNSELENYPLVIEIDSDDYNPEYFKNVGKYNEVEVYACYQSVNLNPFHSVIYFNSSIAYKDALSKAEPSLENKFYKLYSANYVIMPELSQKKKTIFKKMASTEKDEFIWEKKYADIKLEDTLIDTTTDFRLDRIKGFLYCYIIGANKSTSGEVAHLKAIARQLRNTLSAVINSPDHRPTDFQDKELLTGIQEFNKIYSSIDTDPIDNAITIKRKLEDNPLNLSYEDVKHLLEHFRLFNTFCKSLNLKEVYDAGELWTCLDYGSQESFKRVTESMEAAIRKLELKGGENSEKYNINSLVQVNSDLTIQILDDSYNHGFYEKLIQSQIKEDYKRVMEEKGAKEPLAQAYNGGMILKTILGDRWEVDAAKQYTQALLNHFQDNVAFDLFAIESEVLQSFAAFCQKGDKIERLEDYLEQCGFSNFRLAYGIYGATRGFASLPKTFTSSIIDDDREYIQEFSKSVWKMLNRIELGNVTLPEPKEIYMANDPFPQEDTAETFLGATASTSKFSLQVNEDFNSPSFKFKGFDKEKDTLFEGLQKALDELGGEVNPQKLLYLLDSKYQHFGWKKGKKAWNNLRDKIMPSYQKTSSNAAKKGKEESYLSPSLFPQTKEKEKKLPFTDDNADEIISQVAKELNIEEAVAKILTNDLKYVLNPLYRGNRSNEELLKAFIQIVEKGKEQTTTKKGVDVSWKKELYKSLDSSKIERTILHVLKL